MFCLNPPSVTRDSAYKVVNINKLTGNKQKIIHYREKSTVTATRNKTKLCPFVYFLLESQVICLCFQLCCLNPPSVT